MMGDIPIHRWHAMLTERFSRLFDRLLERWLTYQDAPRDPDRVVELAAARLALDDTRNDIAAEREQLVGNTRELDGPRVAVSSDELNRLHVVGIGVDIA